MSCMFRIGTVVFVIFDVPVETADPVRLRLLLGNAKLAWLNTLSASARICRPIPSRMANVLLSDRLTVLNAGPVN